MSLDLAFIPVEFENSDWGYGHSAIESHAGGWWYDRLKDLPRTPVPPKFNTFRGKDAKGEHCYGDTQVTPYGEPLECVTVAQIIFVVTGTYPSSREIGIVHFLQHLGKDTRVALYWH